MQIEDKPPFDTPFEWIGGEPPVRALVDRFYDLMDLEPCYKELRAAHGSTLQDARDKLFWFLCGWLGGPEHYTERFGHPRLRMRHMPFSIGALERDRVVAAPITLNPACPAIGPTPSRYPSGSVPSKFSTRQAILDVPTSKMATTPRCIAARRKARMARWDW